MARAKSEDSGQRLWPASAPEMRKISDLRLRDENPRSHTLDQIEQISDSIKRWGWTIPVLIDESGLIIAGHGRVRAARLMGYTEAPCVVARGWTEDEKRAYVIADNQIAQNSEWDQKRLRTELRALVAADFDLPLIGFTDGELTKLMVDPSAIGRSSAPEEVTMYRCPACGKLNRKLADETEG